MSAGNRPVPIIAEQPAAPDGKPWLVLDPEPGGFALRSSHSDYLTALLQAMPREQVERVPPARLHTPTAWARLSPVQRDRIGAIALAVAFGSIGAGQSDAHDHAYGEAMLLLEQTVLALLELWPAGTLPPAPDLAALASRSSKRLTSQEHGSP